MLQPMGPQRAGHNWVTEQNHQDKTARKGSSYQSMETDSSVEMIPWSATALVKESSQHWWCHRNGSKKINSSTALSSGVPFPVSSWPRPEGKRTHWCNLTNSSPKAQSKVEKGREDIWNGGGYLPHKPWLKWLQISGWYTCFSKVQKGKPLSNLHLTGK